jgi:hypothetical protein
MNPRLIVHVILAFRDSFFHKIINRFGLSILRFAKESNQRFSSTLPLPALTI